MRKLPKRRFPEAALAAAESLLSEHDGPEDHIRQNIGRLLDALGIENELTYRTAEGPADIYLPRRRIFIEAKSIGLADDPDKPQARNNDESPRQQMERYLLSELREERDLPLESTHDRPWTGFVTDGHVWHAWLYHAKSGKVMQHPLDGFRPSSAEELLGTIWPLVESNPIGKPWIFADPRPLFEPLREELQKIFEGLREQHWAETATKQQLWLDMLRTSNMEPENDTAAQRLFVTHSFLVALARGVIHTLARPREKPDPRKILADGFVAWITATVAGRQWAQGFLEKIHAYEWRRRRGDVLRPLYERFVDARDRQDFGEYYTPDWLAEIIVHEVLDDDWCEHAVEAALGADRNPECLYGRGVLDPTCGSGTFLYHAARRILESDALAKQQLDSVGRARVVAGLVNGIDVHPVAAEIARATLLRALPAEPPGGSAAIRVYEGDALLVRSHDENSLFRPTNGEFRFETPAGRTVLLPRSFVNLAGFADLLRRLVGSAIEDQPVPHDVRASIPKEDRDSLVKARDSLAEIVREEGNSVWTWFITNITGPFRLMEQKIDRIVANPPWVSMAGIQAVSRKRALEEFAKDPCGLWTGGKNAPHFDIAQLFVKRCREIYLADPNNDPAGWLVKRAALKSEGWSKFRKWHTEGVLAQSIDLLEIQPFGSGDARRCCILFDHRPSSTTLTGVQGRELQARILGQERPEQDMPRTTALELMEFVPAETPFPRQASDYCDAKGRPWFRQGATVTPLVLTVADTVRREKTGSERLLAVTTAKSTKKPWSRIDSQVGEFPENWMRHLLTSNDLYPFVTAHHLPQAIIPVNQKGQLLADPGAVSDSWQEFDEIYREHRGRGMRTPKSLINQIDFSKKLSSQLSLTGTKRTLVLHPTSGDIMRAARVTPGLAIIGHSLHYYPAITEAEAAYLVGVLNSPALNPAFVGSRTSGRHFVNNPWRAVPIPRYSHNDNLHREIARLARRAEKIANQWCSENPSRGGQLAISKRIRGLLKDSGILDSLDDSVHQLLPQHVRGR